ncbi:hypothetical protein C4564_03710 [Candidatus Microgenomates bacterium]|nr:MAG: hypothetical protein C4564_03710 [Candidatus Microgenomates bacterium]
MKIGGAVAAQAQNAAKAAMAGARDEARATAKSAMDQVGLPAEGILGGDESDADTGAQVSQVPQFDPVAYRQQVQARDDAALQAVKKRLLAQIQGAQAQAANIIQQEQQRVAQLQADQMAGGTPEELAAQQETQQKSGFVEGLKRRLGQVGKGKSEKGRAAKG